MPEKPHYITPIEYGGGFHQEPTVIQAAGPRVKNGDWLALTLTTSDATGSVEIRGRILTDAGEIVPFQQIMTFSGTGTQTAVVARLGGGWLQGFSVHRVSGTLTDGEVVAAVHLGTSEGTPAAYECCLASGEVTNIRSLGMGAYLIAAAAATTAAPTITNALQSNPAAGANFSITVTASQVWEILAVRSLLTTSATVATRTYSVVIDDGTNTLLRIEANATQAASLAYAYAAADFGASYGPTTTTSYIIPLPNIMLAAGSRIRSVINNIQAADQLTEVLVSYRQY